MLKSQRRINRIKKKSYYYAPWLGKKISLGLNFVNYKTIISKVTPNLKFCNSKIVNA
jgi:hypothetical protein